MRTTLPAVVTTLLGLAGAAALCGGADAHANSAPVLHGQLVLPIVDINETLDPFDIVIHGSTVNTGQVTMSIDPGGSQSPTITFDFDKMTVDLETPLLINSPALKQLGSGPIPVMVSEQGPFAIKKQMGKRGTVRIAVTYNTESVGVVMSGPINGAQFKNKKDPARCNQPGGGNGVSRMAVNIDDGGNVLSGEPLPSKTTFLCAIDNGVLMFQHQKIAFDGDRQGDVGPSAGAK